VSEFGGPEVLTPAVNVASARTTFKVPVVRETRIWRDGLLLLRHFTSLARRDVVYFRSGAYTAARAARWTQRLRRFGIKHISPSIDISIIQFLLCTVRGSRVGNPAAQVKARSGILSLGDWPPGRAQRRSHTDTLAL
jgi:hypothetical protein